MVSIRLDLLMNCTDNRGICQTIKSNNGHKNLCVSYYNQCYSSEIYLEIFSINNQINELSSRLKVLKNNCKHELFNAKIDSYKMYDAYGGYDWNSKLELKCAICGSYLQAANDKERDMHMFLLSNNGKYNSIANFCDYEAEIIKKHLALGNYYLTANGKLKIREA